MPERDLALVTLYARAGCHLCDAALSLLQRLAPRLHFRVHVVDIETDDDLHRRYLYEIPVVALDGRDLVRAPIYPRPLEDALTEALKARSTA
ncbi:MAG: glutaredoxin family protein [Gemmataceae bacterium]|nr:glutaredoxin family protein [Gemmataceae bacterium]